MKVITEGHRYQLDNFEDSNGHQVLQFIEKAHNETSNKLETVSDGTTNEEVLRMLISRMEFLYKKLPSDETKEAIDHCKNALTLLESRAKDREERGVKGTPIV